MAGTSKLTSGNQRGVTNLARCSRRPPRIIIQPCWSGWTPSRRAGAALLKDSDAAKAYYERAAALGDAGAKAALESLRCPYVIKDKRGNVVSNLCF